MRMSAATAGAQEEPTRPAAQTTASPMQLEVAEPNSMQACSLHPATRSNSIWQQANAGPNQPTATGCTHADPAVIFAGSLRIWSSRLPASSQLQKQKAQAMARQSVLQRETAAAPLRAACSAQAAAAASRAWQWQRRSVLRARLPGGCQRRSRRRWQLRRQLRSAPWTGPSWRGAWFELTSSPCCPCHSEAPL